MGVTGYVGLPRSGKTLRMAQLGMEAMKAGRDVYANFALGERVAGYVMPVCPVWEGGYCLGEWQHGWHNPTDWVFVRREDALASGAARYRLREGRGFIKYPHMTVLESWEQVIALRVARDVFGVAHRLRLDRGPDREGDDGEIEQTWEAVPTCKWYVCNGCSSGITVLLDELNGWAPARLWQRLGVGVMNRWSYSGKDGLEIVWSAQHQSFVDKYAREVTNFIWQCSKMGLWRSDGSPVRILGVPMVMFHRDKWIPALLTDSSGVVTGEVLASAHKPLQRDWSTWWTMAEAMDHYDTYERVAQIEIRPARRLKAVRSA